MSKKLLKSEEKMSRAQAAQKMHEIADKISEGHIELSSGTDNVILEPSENVEFEIQVEEERDGDLSIEVEVEWSAKEAEEGVEIA